jgi:hypothetical protein
MVSVVSVLLLLQAATVKEATAAIAKNLMFFFISY